MTSERDVLQIKLFARAKELAGTALIEIPWNDGETVKRLRERLGESVPSLKPLVPRLLVAINRDYVKDDAPIRATDEVACFPPVSGG